MVVKKLDSIFNVFQEVYDNDSDIPGLFYRTIAEYLGGEQHDKSNPRRVLFWDKRIAIDLYVDLYADQDNSEPEYFTVDIEFFQIGPGAKHGPFDTEKFDVDPDTTWDELADEILDAVEDKSQVVMRHAKESKSARRNRALGEVTIDEWLDKQPDQSKLKAKFADKQHKLGKHKRMSTQDWGRPL